MFSTNNHQLNELLRNQTRKIYDVKNLKESLFIYSKIHSNTSQPEINKKSFKVTMKRQIFPLI